MTPNILYSKSKFGKLMVPYPEKSIACTISCDYCEFPCERYTEAVVASLASALEFVEEDQEKVKYHCYWTPIPVEQTKSFKEWEPKDGQLFTVEGIEVTVENKPGSCRYSECICQSRNDCFGQVVRLKAKPKEISEEAMYLNGYYTKEQLKSFCKESAPPEPKEKKNVHWFVESGSICYYGDQLTVLELQAIADKLNQSTTK